MAKILVVDDEEDMRLTLSLVLSQKGHRVEEASSARMLYAKLKEAAYDLILMDIRMPEIDGFQALKEIKKQGVETPVILVTGYHNSDSAAEAARLGAVGCIKKPFDNQLLVETVNNAVNHQSVARQENFFSKKIIEKLSSSPAESPKSGGPVPAFKKSGRLSARVRISAAALMALVLVLGGAMLFNRARTSPRSYTLPFQNVAAMSWHKGSLWIADWYTHTVYETKIDGKEVVILRSFYLPQYQITGLCFAGDKLYTCDALHKKILQHKLDQYLSVAESSDYPGESPAGLFWDGKFLWSSDFENGLVYKHEVSPAFATLNAVPGAKGAMCVYVDGEHLWSYDPASRKVTAGDIEKSFAAGMSYEIPQVVKGEGNVAAFVIEGKRVWIALEASNVIHSLDLGWLGKFSTAGRQG